jgi:hypothetical protein
MLATMKNQISKIKKLPSLDLGLSGQIQALLTTAIGRSTPVCHRASYAYGPLCLPPPRIHTAIIKENDVASTPHIVDEAALGRHRGSGIWCWGRRRPC